MLTFSLNNESDEPLYHQIYSYIKNEIMSGQLKYQEKLPSARELAAHLLVSRNPVDTAYGQLVAEGYVYSMPKRGYFVSQITHTQTISIENKNETEEPTEKETVWKYDFNPDAVDTEHFPYSVWKAIGRNVLNNRELLQTGDFQGDFALRQAVTDYLHSSRGVVCSSRNVVIGAGIGYLLQLLAGMFQNDKRIAFEEPGYVRAKDILATNGFEVYHIGIDDFGMAVETLRTLDLNLCYITPSHQFPLGTVMSIAKRQQMIQWAGESENHYIIEDDHDSEYRYKGKPIPALQSIDTLGKVIYIGTFSKSIAPALRMGYMVLPDSLMERFREKCGSYNCTVSRIDQALVTDFIRQGYFEKHLNRMRKKYKEKQDAVLNVFRRYEEKVEVSGDFAGFYVIARAKQKTDEAEILREAQKQGIYVRPLSVYYQTLPEDYMPSFLVGFAGAKINELEEGAEIFCRDIL